jgi:hypothetical protein
MASGRDGLEASDWRQSSSAESRGSCSLTRTGVPFPVRAGPGFFFFVCDITDVDLAIQP